MRENYLIYVTTGVREYAEGMQRCFEEALKGTIYMHDVNCRMGNGEIYTDLMKHELVDFNKLSEYANLDC